MLILRQPESKPDSKEDGFILLAVLFLTVLVLIALAVAAPKMARSIQRDKELELVHRGEQYKRAIKLYYKQFGAYPSSIDQLMSTNNIRFLRKRYADPITGKNDWRLIYMGQAKVPPLGFFGQPLTGLTGPANVGTPVGGATGSSFMGAQGAGSSAFGASGSGASGFGSPSSGSSAFGSSGSDSSAFGSSNSGATSTSTDGSDSGSSDASDSSDTDAGSGSSIQGGSVTTSTGGTGSSAFGSSTSGSGNPTLGGGPIVGVGIRSTKASLIEYKKQKHYNQWEFVYNPIEDQMQAAANLFGGGAQNVNGTSGTGGTGTETGIDSGTTGTGFGSSAGTTGTGFGSSFGSGDNGSSGGTSNPPAGSSPNQQ